LVLAHKPTSSLEAALSKTLAGEMVVTCKAATGTPTAVLPLAARRRLQAN